MIKLLILGETPSELTEIENLIIDEEFVIEGSSTNLTNATDEVTGYDPDMVIMSCSDMSWVFRACQQIYLSVAIRSACSTVIPQPFAQPSAALVGLPSASNAADTAGPRFSISLLG